MIGLYDYDLITYKQPIMFNLELMKLSNYYKGARQIVKMLPFFDSSKCTKVYVRKDYEDGFYPRDIVEDPKVDFGGLALFENKYNPMDNIIESRPADTSIYERMVRYHKINSRSEQLFKKLLLSTHLRISFDGKEPFMNWREQLFIPRNKTFIVHDTEPKKFLIQELIDEIEKYELPEFYLGFKFPLIVNTIDDLMFFSKLNKSVRIRTIHCYTNIDIKSAFKLREHRNDFVMCQPSNNNLNYTYLLTLYLLSNGSTVVWDDVIKDSELENVLNDYFLYYHRRRNKTQSTFFDFLKFRRKFIPKEEKIRMFSWVKRTSPELFDSFYDTEFVTIDGWRFKKGLYTFNEKLERGC